MDRTADIECAFHETILFTSIAFFFEIKCQFEREDFYIVKLGPRVIKTGIAVTLALFICSILELESAVFAGIAAIFHPAIDLPNMETSLEPSGNQYTRCHHCPTWIIFSWQ